MTAQATTAAVPGSSRALLLTLAFTEGAAVMIAELAGAKMLTPLYGSSLYVWGAVIGITLISLTAGYFLGGLLSYQRAKREIVYWCLLAASLFILLMPTIAHTMMATIQDMGTIQAILLLTTLYLLPPLLLLGMTPPLIISILANEVDEAGNTAGTVYAVSTIGGILGTFGAGFWLIPEFGLTRTALFGGVMLAILPLALLLRQRHYPALAWPLVLVLILLPRDPAGSHPDVDILYESEGLLGQLKVMDITFHGSQGQSRTDRVLFVNRTGQTWIVRDTGEPVWDYVNYLRSISSLAPEGSHSLLLGLGGGIVAHKLQELGHTVDSVELDERIAKIARDFFDLDHSGDVIVDDGRHFLRSTDRRYDLIIFDVFQAETPPAHMLTVEAFRELRGLLNPGGFVVLNYSGFITGSTGIGARSVYRTLMEADYEVALLPTGTDEATRNNLMIATDGQFDFDVPPRAPIFVNREPQPLSRFFHDPEAINLDNAHILRDNQPILEKLNIEPATVWRQSYHEHFTKPFLEKGIRLFE